MKEEIERAVEVLRRGGIILYPTDTVWGIGCDATDETAVERVYQLKRSCNKKGMIVLTESIDRVGCYFRNVPAVAWDLLAVAFGQFTANVKLLEHLLDHIDPFQVLILVGKAVKFFLAEQGF